MKDGNMRCDAISACVVVPVYNNAATVAEVARAAKTYASTVLVCDDGSTDGSGEAARSTGAEVFTSPTNHGKGAALRKLLQVARDRGFKYAISIDGDGQHSAHDLPKFIAAAQANPGALVVGSRDLIAAGAPKSSEFGRRFSNFWIWFESGVKVEDTQCGFRAYPVDDTLSIGAKRNRYEFESEALLRSAWAGIPIISVPITVIYAKDRVTHFRLFRDNARIVFLNTLACVRLLLPWPLPKPLAPLPHRPGLSLFAIRRWVLLGGAGPLRRTLVGLIGFGAAMLGSAWLPWGLIASAALGIGIFPMILAYGFTSRLERFSHPVVAAAIVYAASLLIGLLEHLSLGKKSSRNWSGRSRGGVVGHWIFYQITRRLGPAPAYWIMYPVAFYFFLTAPAARRASAEFLERVLGPRPGLAGWIRMYRHFLSFAQTIVERMILSVRGPKLFKVQHSGTNHVLQAHREKRGSILLSSHVGNWDLAGGLLTGLGEIPLTIVAFQADDQQLAKYFDNRAGTARVPVISLGKRPFASFEMLRILRDGGMVGIQADRALDEHVVRVPFFGAPASFPIGPFVLAAVSGVPVLRIFALRLGKAEYRIIVDPPQLLTFEPTLTKEVQISKWVSAYASRLEELIRDHPYQWFNFYDFWQ